MKTPEKRNTTPAKPNPAVVYLASMTSGSRRTMRNALESISHLFSDASLETMSWHELRYEHTQAIRTLLIERYSAGTVNKMLSALRGVLRECWRLGLMDSEDYLRAIDLQSMRRDSLPRGRMVSMAEQVKLFRALDKTTPKGARDSAILALLLGAGLRRSEIVALDLEDYDQESGELRIRHAKGDKDRLVYATNGTKAALDHWIEVSEMITGPLFVRIRKNGEILTDRITSQAVYNMIHELSDITDITMSPHDARHTYLSNLLDAGADVFTVQALAGHSSPEVTKRYDRRGERAKMEAAKKVSVPY